MSELPSIRAIQRRVAERYNVRLTDLRSARRERVLVQPRHTAIYLCRRLTAHSLPAIGRHFGGRDHTSIAYACRKAEARMAREPKFAAEIDTLCEEFVAAAGAEPAAVKRDVILSAMTGLLVRRKECLDRLDYVERRIDEYGQRLWGGAEAASDGDSRP